MLVLYTGKIKKAKILYTTIKLIINIIYNIKINTLASGWAQHMTIK